MSIYRICSYHQSPTHQKCSVITVNACVYVQSSFNLMQVMTILKNSFHRPNPLPPLETMYYSSSGLEGPSIHPSWLGKHIRFSFIFIPCLLKDPSFYQSVKLHVSVIFLYLMIYRISFAEAEGIWCVFDFPLSGVSILFTPGTFAVTLTKQGCKLVTFRQNSPFWIQNWSLF